MIENVRCDVQKTSWLNKMWKCLLQKVKVFDWVLPWPSLSSGDWVYRCF